MNQDVSRAPWSKERQIRVVAMAAAVLLIVVAAIWLGGALLRSPPAAPPTPSPQGTFRPSAQQRKTFSIDKVVLHEFVSAEATEGKIAVNGDRSTPVFSPYSGRVIQVLAKPGDTVRAGAPLAALAAAEFVQAQNDLSVAVAQLKLARLNETRKHALFDAKGGSLQDWQGAQADLITAQTVLESVRNRLRIYGKTDADIAAMEDARRVDQLTMLRAPIAGVVMDRQLGPGQFIQSGGGTALFTIADPSNVWLLANVRETDAGRVQVGQAVDVRVLAYPERVFKARISYVADAVDPVTHRLPVRADIDNRDGALKAEMFASFRIVTSDPTQGPAVPEAAVVYEGDAAHVWVDRDDGLIAYRAVRTGRSSDGLVEITEGLKPGERIVTKGGVFIDQTATPATP
jgi:cobalt-zinc-cadmium efflux system membrane fusion protein